MDGNMVTRRGGFFSFRLERREATWQRPWSPRVPCTRPCSGARTSVGPAPAYVVPHCGTPGTQQALLYRVLLAGTQQGWRSRCVRAVTACARRPTMGGGAGFEHNHTTGARAWEWLAPLHMTEECPRPFPLTASTPSCYPGRGQFKTQLRLLLATRIPRNHPQILCTAASPTV